MDPLKELPVWLLVLIPLLLLSQGTWLFVDARKRAGYPWFWGVWGMISFPLPLILYWVLVRSDWLKHRKRQG
jgi:hypothetical protein